MPSIEKLKMENHVTGPETHILVQLLSFFFPLQLTLYKAGQVLWKFKLLNIEKSLQPHMQRTDN